MDRKKILVCDDDPGILEMLELILEETGHIIIPEQNSLNVKMIIEKESPDLLLIDLWMPVISGDQILVAVRSNPQTTALPVIIFSASKDGADIAKKSGATAFVAKPFDIDELFSTINSCLN